MTETCGSRGFVVEREGGREGRMANKISLQKEREGQGGRQPERFFGGENAV